MSHSIREAIARRVVAVVPGIVRAKLMEMSGPGGVIDKIIRERIGVDLPNDVPMSHPQFIFAMAQEFASVDRGMVATDALTLARDTLSQFLRDEKIGFGAADWDWTREGAITLAQEYEIEHWEAA